MLFVKIIMSDEKTIFQKIADREIPGNFVYEDDEIFAIRDIAPKAPVHILIIPKEPIPTVMDCTQEHTELLGKMVMIAKKIAAEEELEGYKLLFNCGKKGGQVVFHIHLHLLGGGKIDLENT